MQGWESSLINTVIISDVRTGLQKASSESLCLTAGRRVGRWDHPTRPGCPLCHSGVLTASGQWEQGHPWVLDGLDGLDRYWRWHGSLCTGMSGATLSPVFPHEPRSRPWLIARQIPRELGPSLFRPRLLVIPASGCSGGERREGPAVRRKACRPSCNAASSPAPRPLRLLPTSRQLRGLFAKCRASPRCPQQPVHRQSSCRFCSPFSAWRGA